MPVEAINGVRLFSELRGDSGPPVVLVHGSGTDHHTWDAVVPALAKTSRVLTYDRRGHGVSERPAAQGGIDDDVADLAALIGAHGFSPAHLVGTESGASIVLKLASIHGDRCASLAVHEPQLTGVLEELDLERLSSFGGPVLMSRGDQSPPSFRAILDSIADALPRAQEYTFRGAGHDPYVTHPDDFATVVGSFIAGVAAQ